jgi:prevent-host-death family protein
MTVEVNVHEAKTHLSRLLQRVMNGEEVVIARAGTPVARLIPYTPRLSTRQPGRYAGQIRIADDFDDELPVDLQVLFEGGGDADSR